MQKSTGLPASEYIPFELRYTFKERVEKFQKQKKQKPEFIALIVERHAKSKLPLIDKTRFVCQKHNKFILVQTMIETKVSKAVKDGNKKEGKTSFFLYIKNQIPKADDNMEEIYSKYKSDDGFVYIQYGEMETFGAQ